MTLDSTKLSRTQRQAQTRERLIEVARELFLRDGYAATSLDKVAVEAGFSKGAVYSNFEGKEELCMAVLDGIHAEQTEGVIEAFSGSGNLEDKFEAFSAWAQTGLGNPRWTALEVEFAAVARHSPYVARALAERHRSITAAIAQLIRSVSDMQGVTLKQSPEDAAVVLLSTGIGLGALRSLDPNLDVNVFTDAMRALLGGTE